MGMAGRRRQPALPNISFLILNTECFKRKTLLSIRSYTKIYKHLAKYYSHIHFMVPWCKYNVSVPVTTDAPPSFVFYFFFSLCPQVPSPARALSNSQKILTESGNGPTSSGKDSRSLESCSPAWWKVLKKRMSREVGTREGAGGLPTSGGVWWHQEFVNSFRCLSPWHMLAG